MARKKEKEKFDDSKKKEKGIPKQEYTLDSREAGKIKLKDESREGLLVLIETSEEIKTEQEHGANVKSIDFNGILNVKNPSSVDRIWNIEIKLKNIEDTSLDSNGINIKELGINDDDNSYSQNFRLVKEVKNRLFVKEYINTSHNADDILDFKAIETDLTKLKNKNLTIEKKKEEKKPILEKEEKIETSPQEDVEKNVKEWWEQLNAHRKEEGDLKVETREEENKDLGDSGNVSEELDVNIVGYELESFGLAINQENNVKFVVAMLNSFEIPITKVKLVKNIPLEFENLAITSASMGLAKIEDNKLIWTIENLPAGNCVFLKFSADVQIKGLETIGSGSIEIAYTTTSSFLEGLEIEKFEALTRNKFYVDMIERDETPGLWDCSLVFENPSEFKIELFNANVHSPENETKNFVIIDPNNTPKLPAGARWYSNPWQYESKDYPAFLKKLDFRVMPAFKTEVKGIIIVDEARFILASIGGEIVYKATEPTKVPLREEIEENVIIIPSYKEANVNAVLKVVNNGSAPLNEVIIEHAYFSEIFQPPKIEEVKLLWNGKEIDVGPANIFILESSPKKLIVVLKNLRESPWGMFEPNSIIEVSHPIHVINPPKDAKLDPEVIFRANTYPLGQEVIYVPKPENVPKIQVIHIRRKYRVGKEIAPIGEIGNYEIILIVENIGEFSLREFVLMDKVPRNFECGEFSTDPEVTSEEGTKFLKWSVEPIEEGKTLEFRYKIRGQGQYHPSKAQLAI